MHTNTMVISSNSSNKYVFDFWEFHKYRGGCIGCMDYYYYSWEWTINGYLSLRSHFDQISDVLLGTLNAFKQNGFSPDRGHMFSMSFGSQLAINAGRDFGGQIGSIDGIRILYTNLVVSWSKTL